MVSVVVLIDWDYGSWKVKCVILLPHVFSLYRQVHYF